MPNECVNILTIKGDDVSRFIDDNRGSIKPLSFRNLVSHMETLPDECESAEWQKRNWGTSADVDRPDCVCLIVEPDSESAMYLFSTVAAPPIEWFEAATSKYKNMAAVLEYLMENIPMAGNVIMEKGEVVGNEQFLEPDSFKEQKGSIMRKMDEIAGIITRRV